MAYERCARGVGRDIYVHCDRCVGCSSDDHSIAKKGRQIMSQVQCDYCGKMVEEAKSEKCMSKYGSEMIACPRCVSRVFDARSQQDYYNQFDPMED